MNKDILSKAVVLSVIFLFIGMSVIPSTAINIDYRKSSTLLSIGGKTLYVGGSGPNNYTKIQDAIDNASDGDTVFVYDDSSPYYENVYINKSINLIGEDKNTTIIDGDNYGDVIYITAHWVDINGFTIQNSGGWNQIGTGVVIIYSDNVIVSNNIVTKNIKGIWNMGDYCKIYNNVLSNNDLGIYLDEGNLNHVYENLLSNNSCGICSVYGNSNLINKNIFRDNQIGMDSTGGGRTIANNNFINNDIHAFFNNVLPGYRTRQKWLHNYWDDWNNRLLRLIKGETYIFLFIMVLGPFPSFQFDLFPAQKPYDI